MFDWPSPTDVSDFGNVMIFFEAPGTGGIGSDAAVLRATRLNLEVFGAFGILMILVDLFLRIELKI